MAACGRAELDRIRYEGSVETLSLSGDGDAVFTSGEMLAVWNLKDGSALWQKRGGFTDVTNPSTQPAELSRDGRLVARASATKKTTALAWMLRPNCATGRQANHLLGDNIEPRSALRRSRMEASRSSRAQITANYVTGVVLRADHLC